jgi:hypothetical protein
LRVWKEWRVGGGMMAVGGLGRAEKGTNTSLICLNYRN